MPITSHAQTVNVKQDAIAEIVQRELAFQAKLLPTVTDVSVYAKPGEKSCSFPKAGAFTVENRTAGTEGTSQNLAYAVDKIDFDYRAHVQWLVEDIDAWQASPDIRADHLRRATSAHARNIDSIILAKLSNAAGHAEAAGITQAKILNAIQYLDQNHATDEDRFLVIPPSGRNTMLQITDFVRADAYGTSNIAKGVIGEVYGCKVIQHAAATSALIYTKEALAWAFQRGAKYDEQKAITYGAGSYLAVLDQLYGSKAVRLGEGKELDNTTAIGAAESPFIAKIG